MNTLTTQVSQQPVEPGARELTFRELLARFSRRRWSIVITMLTCVLACVVISLVVEPRFKSEVELVVEGRTATSPMGSSDPLELFTMPTTDQDVLTQAEVLQSYDVISKAFEQENVFLPPPGSDIAGPVVDVKPVGDTNAMVLSVTTNNPDSAVKVAKAIPAVYLRYVQSQRSAQIESLSHYLEQQLSKQQEILLQDDLAIKAVREKHGLPSNDQEPLERAARYSRAQDESHQALEAYEGAEKRYLQLVNDRKAIAQQLDQKSTQANTQEIEQQKNQIGILEAKRDADLVDNTPDAPIVKQDVAQIVSEQKRLKAIPTHIDTSINQRNPQLLDIDMKIADAHALFESAKASYVRAQQYEQQTQSDVELLSRVQPEINTITHKLLNDQQVMLATQNSLNELAMRRSSVKDPIRVVTDASIPKQVRPRWLLYTALSLVIGFLLSLAVVSIRENMDDRITSTGKAYEVAGLPTITFLPRLTGRGKKGALASGAASLSALPDQTLSRYRLLRYNIQIATQPEEVKSIVVASSGRGEGRTTVALNLARSLAQDDKSVILVDMDVLQPSLANRLGLPPGPGITDVLMNSNELGTVVQETKIPGLKFLGAGTILSKAAEMLQTDRFRDVHDQLCGLADYVVFDTPATLSSVDAAVVSSVADACVYLAKLGVTPTQSLRRGTSLLRAANARVVGIAFTDARGEVDPTLDMLN